MDSIQLQQEIFDLEQRWAEAELRRDAETMRQILSDDIVATNFLGLVSNDRETIIQSSLDPNLVVSSIAYQDVTARVFGDAVVTTGGASIASAYAGTDMTGSYRFTRVYIHREGRWQMVASHTTHVADENPFQ